MRALLPLGMAMGILASGCQDNPSSQKGPSAVAPSASTSTASSASPTGSGSSAAPAQTGSSAAMTLTPEQERAARSDVVNDCLACHTDEMLAQQRLTAKQWEKVIKKMQGWGSTLEGSRVDTMVAYLSARYGLTAPPFEPKVIDAAAAEEALAKQPDGPFAKGDAKKGEALYKEACSSCHGATARGTAKGVNIADRPFLWRAAEFAAVVHTGKGRMPAFPAYKDEEIAAVLAYLRSVRPP